MTVIGRSMPRLEDSPLLTGEGRFVADLSLPRQLHMRVVRSAHAHGWICTIDATAALALPGVAAIWTFRDVSDVPPIDLRDGHVAHLAPYLQPALACDRVRYVGEPVAAVFAEDAYRAEDAADLVAVEIEELPTVLAAEAAPASFDADHSTEAEIIRKGYGDVEAGFLGAHDIVELELQVGRHSGVPIETRGALAHYDPVADRLELHGAAKVPHRTRDLLARALRRSPSSVHLHKAMSAAASAFAASFIPRTCSSRSPQCGWAGRSSGSRTGAST
jgi:aerobic carbon-monoxide dehydrogenase large subunit